MPEERLLQDYLNDMIESISDIKDFTTGMTLEEFAKDRKTVRSNFEKDSFRFVWRGVSMRGSSGSALHNQSLLE